MKRGTGKLSAGIILACLVIGICEANENRKYKGVANKGIPSEWVEDLYGENNGQIELFTDVHAGIEAAGVHGGEYGFSTSRELQFDIFKYQQWYIHFAIEERNIFEDSPSQLDHTIQYFQAGYETPNGRIGLFWDHTCNNPTRNIPDTEHNEIRWNEIGLGYETTAMRFGHEYDGLSFNNESEWLNKISWGMSASRVWMRHENDYDYMFKAKVRDDIFRTGNHVFYTQFEMNAINSDRGTEVDTSLEFGDRIRAGKNVRIVPFVSYEHYNNWYGLDDGEDLFRAGIRLEASLGGAKDNEKGCEKIDEPRSERFDRPREQPMRIRINGGYNVNLHGTYKESRSSDLNVDLDVLRIDDDTTFSVNTYAGILTDAGSFDIHNVNYKIGPSLRIERDDYYWRLFHSYACLYGVDHDGVIRNYNLVGAEIGKEDKISWRMQGGVYLSNMDFDYDGYLQGMLGYDFYTGEWMAPYVNGYVNHLAGDESESGYAFEGGLRFRGEGGNFVLYLRLEDNFDVFRFGQGEQRWLGFRFEF
jgi:hypothetical protein